MTELAKELDGVHYINVWNHGNTELGRNLHPYAETNFVHPVHGKFRTLEGYMRYLRFEKPHDEFRDMTAYQAKRHASTVLFTTDEKLLFAWNNYVELPAYEEAMRLIIEQTPGLKEAFINNTLSFVSFWVHSVNGAVVENWNGKPLLRLLNKLLSEMRLGASTPE